MPESELKSLNIYLVEDSLEIQSGFVAINQASKDCSKYYNE